MRITYISILPPKNASAKIKPFRDASLISVLKLQQEDFDDFGELRELRPA
jgi:hypothetical protein